MRNPEVDLRRRVFIACLCSLLLGVLNDFPRRARNGDMGDVVGTNLGLG